MRENLSKKEEWVQKRLTQARFEHVCTVRDCAGELAVRYGGVQEEAELAGLLHDCARDLPEGELLRLGEEYGLIKHEVERLVPVLLHGPVGAVIVRKELGIEDGQVLRAIAHHTLGAPGMGFLEKIIYLADLIALGRRFPGVECLRKIAQEDLDFALLHGLASSLHYCLRREKLVHPQTVAAWNFFLIQRRFKLREEEW